MDLYKLTAHELHDKLVSKEISSVELTPLLRWQASLALLKTTFVPKAF